MLNSQKANISLLFLDSQLNECSDQAQRPTGKVSEHDFASAFDTSQGGISTRARYGDLYWLSNPKDFHESCRRCHNFIDHFVRLALSKQLEKTHQEKTNGKYVSFYFVVCKTRPLQGYLRRLDVKFEREFQFVG